MIESEPPQPAEDASSTLKNAIYQAVKNVIGLAYPDDGELNISVDNIFPLLKALGFNPQNESVVDLVREASIETFGDINPADFENVVLCMAKELDNALWAKRLEEKERLHHESAAENVKANDERIRMEQERTKAGFEQEEENDNEWEEQRKKEEAEKKERELKVDELYDNMKMAFRFIDSDEDGVISTHDLYVLMMGLGEMLTDDELFGMVNMADLDCDGKVTFDDFKKFLLPQSGDESLILSPAAIAQKLLQCGATITTNSQPETTENAESPEVQNELVNEITENTQQEPTESTPKPEPVKKVCEESAQELSDEEKIRLQKLRQSLLWGYSNSSITSTVDTRIYSCTSVTPIDDDVFDETKQTVSEQFTTTIPVETEEDFTDSTLIPKDSSNQESLGQLGAIREEDENSNYDAEHNDLNEFNANDTNGGKLASAVENKRKVFSRQSSSASVKTKVTDSFGDSGIETMDSVNSSEIRDQPDVFDISDGEVDDEQRATISNEFRMSRAVYNDDEDDEDMIDPLHVHESLSRVSSTESLVKLDIESDRRLPHDSSEDLAAERISNFVNEHTYVEVKPTSPQQVEEEVITQLKQDAEERVNKVSYLQKAILKRSFTAPSLTFHRSKIERPQTARPLNGISCSHIDIDLRCETPPKADIKSYRQFTERVRSARSSNRYQDSYQSERKMSIIDISESINPEEYLQCQKDRQRFPTRPLTRPRSPVTRRAFCPNEKLFRLDSEFDELDRICNDRDSRVRRRVQSARPLRRSPSLSVVGNRKHIERPQSAKIPYTSSKHDHNRRRDVLVVEPLANADELYPNKSTLTTYHHGFKSIWPIGRKINMIQTKRPFQAFEMNSYSRAIERNQFPFKAAHSVKAITREPERRESIPKVAIAKSVIKLEMDTEQVKRPVARNLSLYITPNSIPRAVRW